MQIQSIVGEFLEEEGYTFYSDPPQMMPPKSWVDGGFLIGNLPFFQICTQQGNLLYIVFDEEHTRLEVGKHTNIFHVPARYQTIDIHSPDAFSKLKKYLEAL